MKIGPEALEPAIRCGATHYDRKPEQPAKSPDAETYCATAILAERLAVSCGKCRSCDIPASDSERARNFETSSARRIAARVSTQIERKPRQQPAVAPELVTAVASSSSVEKRHRAPASNSAPHPPANTNGSKRIATREHFRGGDRRSARASDLRR